MKSKFQLFQEKRNWILLGVSALLLFGILFFSYEEPADANEEPVIPTVTEVPSTLKVDVKGSVISPGVYELEEGKRVIDAIEMAGGTLEGSNLHYLNLSKRLEDQMTIYIYTDQEIADYEASLVKTEYIEVPIPCNCPDKQNDACSNASNPSTSLISLNQASKEELMKLPGIGESKADEIIRYRKETPFKNIEEIKNIKGIGDAVFEKLKDQIAI